MAVRILLVEPEQEQRDEFVAAVRGSAFEIAEFAATNQEAVNIYEKVRPHLLVLRLVSGKLGAAAALDLLRRKNRNVKAAVSYDVQTMHLLMSAYSHGAVAAIKQPFRQHRVVEKLTHAVASERHEKLSGPVVRLEHPIQVRYKAGRILSRSKVGFCQRLGLQDMDLNVESRVKTKTKLRLELLFPPPEGSLRFVGIVEDTEMTGPDSSCCYISLNNVSPDARKFIEGFIVKTAKRV